MKKLMIAAAIVCAAAISHGAALEWGLSGITGTDQQKAAGNIGYFMDASTYDVFLTLAPDAIGAYCEANNTDFAVTTTGRAGATLSGKTGDTYSPGDKVSGYIVIFDNSDATEAANYANTSVLSGTFGDVGNLTMTAKFAEGTAGWQAIPEPTSGLLLLIGVAGLALKRRRA